MTNVLRAGCLLFAAIGVSWCVLGAAIGAEPTVILDMDTVRHHPTTTGPDETPIGEVSLVPGKFGKACRFSFREGTGSALFTASVRATPEWDEADGFSFWVRGDGSKSWGGLELIDNSDYSLRYGYCFPIDSTEWRKIVVPWRDLCPELPAGAPVDPENGYRPSGFGNVWFGKWNYWREYPACSFEIDQFALEPEIADDSADHLPEAAGAPRARARIEAGRPVTIVTMGDSLTDTRHWANREVVWPDLLAESLHSLHGSDVSIVNPAIGGTQLSQNLVLTPRWLDETPAPDVVTVCFGYNDWSAGMRGERFREILRMAVDRLRRQTNGRSEIVLMTTCPAVGRWETMNELADAVRDVAREKRTALADVAAAFHEAGADPATRERLYCSDKTHLGPAGHELVAKAVLDAIVADPPEEDAAATTKAIDAPRPITTEHPRLFGSRDRLKQLATDRAEEYARMARVASESNDADHPVILSMALVAAIEDDADLARRAIDRVAPLFNGPIRQGHVTFAHDLAVCAVVYDLCHEHWTDDERATFHAYVNRTVDANVDSETHVFHNGWYAYKNWGIGLAAYAGYHENPRAEAILQTLERDYRTRAAPALELAGAGGGWGEGYYIHYWLYEWCVFCEAARWCEGADYYAMAPSFFDQRAVADMWEMYPGIVEYHSRRPIPMGDGGGRFYGGDRDKSLSARRILASRRRDDPLHRIVHAYNETTPKSSGGVNAYMDFLWRDTSIEQGDLADAPLSHFSSGPGHVYARSSWGDDATYFFFKCGDRFTAHQHLDNGHFVIYRHAELAGDGGHYDAFGSPHDVNYHLRTIAHNTIRVLDPNETWPGIRAGNVVGNDGGQAHAWPHHNGAVSDADAWRKDASLYDIADITAFEDVGAYLYVAGDFTRSYSPDKMESCTRRILYGRPGTFVILDRVAATDASYQKTWTLQAMREPEGEAPRLTITNGEGRLFVETLLPRDPVVALHDGDDLYTYDGRSFPPSRDTGPAPECRVEISPSKPAAVDYFLHVLRATDATVERVPGATFEETDTEVRVTVGSAIIVFEKDGPGGYVEIAGRRRQLPTEIVPPSQEAGR